MGNSGGAGLGSNPPPPAQKTLKLVKWWHGRSSDISNDMLIIKKNTANGFDDLAGRNEKTEKRQSLTNKIVKMEILTVG